MSLLRGFIIILCTSAIANGSLFNHTKIVGEVYSLNGTLRYDYYNIRVHVGDSSAGPIQEFQFYNALRTFQDCSTSNQLCRNNTNGAYLRISSWKDDCVLVNYTTNERETFRAYFHVDQAYVYGFFRQTGYYNWPLKYTRDDSVYMHVETDINRNTYYRAVLEPYWLLSNGSYIYFVGDNYELRVELPFESLTNTRTLKLMSDRFDFVLCKLNDAREAQEHAIKHFFGKPSVKPDTRVVTQPVWKAWDWMEIFWVNKKRLPPRRRPNQTAVMDFAKRIIENGYSGRFAIGLKWELEFGSFKPDTEKFSDFGGMINDLRNLNFTVSLEVHPFVSNEIQLSQNQSGYLMENSTFHDDDFGPIGRGRYINSSNPDALKWFKESLLHLRKTYGIDSFEFDNGYVFPFPFNFISENKETIIKENTKLLASLDSNIVTNIAISDSRKYGFFQSIPLGFYDMKGELSSVIACLLQMNILGYSFVMPNIIGNGLREFHGELFIRWVQLTVFMPSMQFSIHRPPWSYDEKVANLTKRFVNLHANYSSYIIELMDENVRTGAPVNPPIWWISPNDSIALGCRAHQEDPDEPGQLICKSEFLLGDKILVAPVVVENQRKRNVYLPAGCWKDGNSEKTFKGPTWVKDYLADLDILPYFLRYQCEA